MENIEAKAVMDPVELVKDLADKIGIHQLYVIARDMYGETAAEPEKGKWILKPDEKYHCDKCDGIAPKGFRWDFCPNCGADMRGES